MTRAVCAQVKLGHDVRHNLSRPTAWEAVMRIRCSKGLRISAFHGHFFIRSSDLLALPQVPIAHHTVRLHADCFETAPPSWGPTFLHCPQTLCLLGPT